MVGGGGGPVYSVSCNAITAGLVGALRSALGAEGECTALGMPMNSTKTLNISFYRQEIKETIRIADASNSEIGTYR